MPVLTPDWLDALAILRREVGDIRSVFNYVQSFNIPPRSIHCLHTHGEGHYSIAAVESLPKIERVEMYLYAAVQIRTTLREEGIHWRARLSDRVGCANTTSPDPRERWRVIDFKTPAHLLPVACFETRPACKICHQPVATGSGAWTRPIQEGEHGPQLATGSEIEWWKALDSWNRSAMLAQGKEVRYKTDVHEECMRFAHRVLVPARQAQIADEKLQAAAEVDK